MKRFGIFFLLTLALNASITVGSEQGQYNVIIQKDSFKFEPARIFVEVGDTVNWVNQDERRHLTSSIPAGGELEILCEDLYPGKVCSHTFNLPGRYPYFCFIHQNMVGEVIVVE